MVQKKSREAEKKAAPEEVIQDEAVVEEKVELTNQGWVEKYFEVRFSEKSNPNDTTEVQLAVNGECLQIKRGIPVVMPQRFLENADHTCYPQYEQLPDKPRKITSWITTYPYSVIREATKKEFDSMKSEGNAIARQKREQMEGGS